MADVHYFEQNIEKLLTLVQPEPKLSEQRQARIVSVLLAEAQRYRRTGRRWSFGRNWAAVAAAAVIIIAASITAVTLYERLSKQKQIPTVPKVVKEPVKVPTAESVRETKIATEMARIEEMFAAGDISGLVAILSAGEPESRIAAANFLAEIGDSSAISALEKLSAEWAGEGENPFERAIERIRARQQYREVNEPPTKNAAERQIDALLEQGRDGIVILVVEKGSQTPVPDVNVDVRMNYSSTRNTTRVSLITSKYGLCWIDFNDAVPRYLIVRVIKNGFVPLAFAWEEEMDIPDMFTYELEKGTTIGGLVVNEDARPVAGANVTITHMQRQNTEHPWVSIIDYVVATDANGRWIADIIPPETASVSLKLSHPEYADDYMWHTKDYTVEQLREQSAVMVMKRGVALCGRVVNGSGEPVSNTYVVDGRNLYANTPQTMTDEEGRFDFGTIGHRDVVLTVVADGYGPELMRFDSATLTGPVEIVLGLGHTIAGRVVDCNGLAIAGATVMTRGWRGLETLSWSAKVNEEGCFAWHGAPSDEVKIVAYADGYVNSEPILMAADGREYKVVLLRELRVLGTVSDANTKKPIEQFRVIVGTRQDREHNIIWQVGNKFWDRVFTDGEFALSFDIPDEAYAIRIEANGYLPLTSRQVGIEEENVKLEFALEKAGSISGTVLLPDGTPAAGAEVYVVRAGGYLSLRNGVKDNMIPGDYVATGSDGRFSIGPQAEPYKIVAIHNAGFAELSQSHFEHIGKVLLKPWGRVEVLLRKGTEPQEYHNVSLVNVQPENDANRMYRTYGYTAVTDERGKCILERVVPCRMQVKWVSLDDGGRRTAIVEYGEIEVLPGRTVSLTLDSGTTTVVGKFEISDRVREFEGWTAPQVCFIESRLPGIERLYEQLHLPLPDRFGEMSFDEQARWYVTFLGSSEGQQFVERAAQKLTEEHRPWKEFCDVPASDYSFRAQEIPPGYYMLDVNCYRSVDVDTGTNGWELSGRLQHEFTVPENYDANVPLDLGILTVGPVAGLKVGEKAPMFEAESADRQTIRLSHFAGRVVLICFWDMGMSSDGFGQMDVVGRIHRQFDGESFDVLSVMMAAPVSPFVEMARKYAGEHNIIWTQGFIDSNSIVRGMFEVGELPWNVLVGPDGRVLAVGLKGEKLEHAVAEALGE